MEAVSVMKSLKYLVAASAAVAMFGMASAASAADDVTNTAHNLTLTTNNVYATSGTDEICVFCHTPHAASTSAKPLWNREDSAASYTMYDSVWSSTMDMTVAGTPQGVSLACLSCHDGTVALDAFQNAPGSGGGVVGSEGYTFTGAGAGNIFPTASFAMLGPDMTNDHPISVTYAISGPNSDSAFNAEGTFTNVTLANGNVECSSCHNPHDDTNGTFLRASNAASALCKECHIK